MILVLACSDFLSGVLGLSDLFFAGESKHQNLKSNFGEFSTSNIVKTRAKDPQSAADKASERYRQSTSALQTKQVNVTDTSQVGVTDKAG